jgi:2-oxoglutarate ferredoxin oxidoreductase subunit gamma
MYFDAIIAGFGGQGIMVIGRALCYAGMKEGKEVSWLPSYGPEMRGGTANCTVVMSDKSVGSPVVECPLALVAMNLPSLDKFEPKVRQGGLVVYNVSLINREPKRGDLRVIPIRANEIANELGVPKALNMVALGALVAASEVVKIETVQEVVEEMFAGNEKVKEKNREALMAGYLEVKGR